MSVTPTHPTVGISGLSRENPWQIRSTGSPNDDGRFIEPYDPAPEFKLCSKAPAELRDSYMVPALRHHGKTSGKSCRWPVVDSLKFDSADLGRSLSARIFACFCSGRQFREARVAAQPVISHMALADLR